MDDGGRSSNQGEPGNANEGRTKGKRRANEKGGSYRQVSCNTRSKGRGSRGKAAGEADAQMYTTLKSVSASNGSSSVFTCRSYVRPERSAPLRTAMRVHQAFETSASASARESSVTFVRAVGNADGEQRKRKGGKGKSQFRFSRGMGIGSNSPAKQQQER